MKIGYQCCFCKESIENEICGVQLILNWDGPPEENNEHQMFFCHPKCFSLITKESLARPLPETEPVYKIAGKEVTQDEWQANVRERLGKKPN